MKKKLSLCLSSLQWCDVVVVPDSFSTDKTEEMARQAGVRFVQRRFDNYAAQRNYGLSDIIYIHNWLLMVVAEIKIRVRVISPGGLPAGMKEEDLGLKSIPRNPLLFGILYRMDIAEQVGSGIRRIRQLYHDYGVGTPQVQVEENWITIVFERNTVPSEDVTEQVTPQVVRLLQALDKPYERRELQEKLGLRDREHFRKQYIKPALKAGLIAMSNLNKPRAADQKYSITELGKSVIVDG